MSGGLVILRSTSRVLPAQVTVAVREPVSVAGGVGGWESLARPGRDPVHWWRGGQDTTLTLDGTIDGTRRRLAGTDTGTVEDRLMRLYSLGRRRGGTASPPTVRLAGDVHDHHTAGGGVWVVQGVTHTVTLHGPGGRPTRVAVQVEMTAYREVDDIEARTQVRRTRDNAGTRRRRRVVTRAGDTLRGVALRETGNQSGWRAILAANRAALGGSRPVGPDATLRPGLRLVIP